MKELQAMVGYTVISNDEYRNLILENKELRESLENSSAEDLIDNKYEKFEKYFLDELDNDNNYMIRNLEKKKDGRLDTTSYYYSELQNKFLRIGIDDLNYIYIVIFKLYQKYKEEQKQIKKEQEKNDN